MRCAKLQFNQVIFAVYAYRKVLKNLRYVIHFVKYVCKTISNQAY